jgi:RimJ/RimL family protein N-acetyltransferase
MVSYAHQHFGPTRVVAFLEPGHAASRNVLIKTGFNSVGTTEYVDATNGQIHLSEVLEIPKHKLALG